MAFAGLLGSLAACFSSPPSDEDECAPVDASALQDAPDGASIAADTATQVVDASPGDVDAGPPPTWHLEDAGAWVTGAVWGSGPHDVFVGTLHGILHSQGDGVWTAEKTDLDGPIGCIMGSGSGDIFASVWSFPDPDAGLPYGDLLHSYGDGKWWRVGSDGRYSPPSSPSPFGPPFGKIPYAIWAVDLDDVYVSGVGYNDNGAGFLLQFASSDGGPFAWSSQAFVAPTAASIWATGNEVYLAAYRMLHSPDRGAHFSAEAVPARVIGVWAPANDDVYAISDDDVSEVFHSKGDGVWTTQPLPPRDPNEDWAPTSIRGTSANDIWIVGSGFSGHGAVLRSDGSGVWTRIPLDGNPGLTWVWGSSSRDVYATGIEQTVYHWR
jgi:hypothetical protein